MSCNKWFYSKDCGMLINESKIDEIYIEKKYCKLMLVIRGQKYCIAEYSTVEQCNIALTDIIANMQVSDIINVPTEQEMKIRTRTKERQRAADGSKTKRRGGS